MGRGWRSSTFNSSDWPKVQLYANVGPTVSCYLCTVKHVQIFFRTEWPMLLKLCIQHRVSICWNKYGLNHDWSNEPSHEIMTLFVLRKLILQTRMRGHTAGLDVLFFVRTRRLLPYFMCTNSEGSGETSRMRRLAWAFAGRLCDKYHNLMNWLKWWPNDGLWPFYGTVKSSLSNLYGKIGQWHFRKLL